MVFCNRTAQEVSINWRVCSYLCSCWFFKYCLSSSVTAATPSPFCWITTRITEWSQANKWLLYILNMEEDVIITLSDFPSITNLNSNNSCLLPDHWLRPRHHSPAVGTRAWTRAFTYLQLKDGIPMLSVWCIFNLTLWEISIWKACPQSNETLLKLQSVAGRTLLTSSTGTTLHSGASSAPHPPGTSS